MTFFTTFLSVLTGLIIWHFISKLEFYYHQWQWRRLKLEHPMPQDGYHTIVPAVDCTIWLTLDPAIKIDTICIDSTTTHLHGVKNIKYASIAHEVFFKFNDRQNDIYCYSLQDISFLFQGQQINVKKILNIQR